MAWFASAEWNAGLAHSGDALCGLLAENGTLRSADLAISEIGGPAELVYRMGLKPLHAGIFQGMRASP